MIHPEHKPTPAWPLAAALFATVLIGLSASGCDPASAGGNAPPRTEPTATAAGASLPASPAAEESKAPTAPADPGPLRIVTFDDIKLDMKKGDPYDSSLLTDKVKKLDGRLIRVSGYILPGFEQSGIKRFVLVRDNMSCCFGPGAMLHDCVMVEMVPGATTRYTTSAVSVEGIFKVHEVKGLDGNYLAIYHLDAREVK